MNISFLRFEIPCSWQMSLRVDVNQNTNVTSAMPKKSITLKT